MAGINLAIISGNVGKDPEIKTINSGASVATFSVATTKKWVTKEGEKKEITQWHRVEAWAGLAKLAEYIKKGSPVTVVGELQYENYTDKDGVERNITKINARDMFIGFVRSESSLSSYMPSAQPAEQLTQPVEQDTSSIDDDDTLPF